MSSIPYSDIIDRFAFCDPASGKQPVKRVRAKSAIVVAGADFMNRIYVLYAWSARTTTEKLIDKIIEISNQYRVRSFGIEANAMQSLFADTVHIIALQKSRTKVPIVPITQPTKITKEWRIRTIIQPVLADGRLFTLHSQYELESQIATHPMATIVDLVDALASVIKMIPKRAAKRQQAAERQALGDYLRETGVSPASVAERLAEVDSEESQDVSRTR